MSEEEIIRGCLRGQPQYQKYLYERYAGKMFAVCLRYSRNQQDAADTLQEGFLKVFTRLEQFQFNGSFEGWVRKVMINTALRQYQKQRFDKEQTGLDSIPDTPVSPDAISALSEKELMDMIAKLPEGYRLVFNLVAIEGFSHAEAAEALGIQEGTSRSQLTKARRWLVEQVNEVNKIKV